MKVLMICTVPLAGNGISTCVIHYACGLADEGIQSNILAPQGVPSHIVQRLAQKNVVLHELPNRKEGTVKYLLELYRHLRHGRYDIVHIHGNSCTMALELMAAALAGCPVRIAHGHSTNCEHQKAHRLLRPFFELFVSARVSCGDEAGRWLYRRKPYTVVRNGIYPEAFAPDSAIRAEVRSKLNIPQDTLVLGHIGMFSAVKNHPFLIQLSSELVRRGKDFRLLLIGDGELLPQIRSSVAGKLDDTVLFTGAVANPAQYLQAIDIFLLPSHYEGLPFVLVEAQAAGLPALVSENVSREADLTGNLTFLPIDDPCRWADAIESLSLPHRQETAASARKKLARSGYDMTENARQLLQLYRSVQKKGS